VSVFVVADQKGSGEIAGWITPLAQRYQQRIDVAGIAALPGIPPMFQGLFRREFKKRLAFPVMLDWTGDVARSVGYESNRAQLLVVSRSGRIALTKSGPANEQALAEVIGEIDRLQSKP
jgi:predicted transcriptional regulator